jgi:hypothetical protein
MIEEHIVTPGDVRGVVIECLRRIPPPVGSTPPFQLVHLFTEVAKTSKARGLKVAPNINAWLENRYGMPELYANLRTPVNEIIWDLIVEGIVRPGDGKAEFDLPYIHVTEYGKEALKGGVTPYDPNGYLKEISEKVPTADPIVTKYIAESAETLRRNCLLSSTITLGCASEKALLLLVEAYTAALNPTDQAAFTAEIDKARGIKQQHKVFKEWYEAKLRAKVKATGKDADWMSAFDDCLLFIFSYLRDMRNDAGHPTGIVFSREKVNSHLVIFPYYLRVMYDLIEWLSANKPV